jgi:hypothetical protein
MANEEMKGKIIDVFKKWSNLQQDVIHVQFLKDDREAVVEWLENIITQMIHTDTIQCKPVIDSKSQSQMSPNNSLSDKSSDSRKFGKAPPPPPPVTRFQHLTTHASYTDNRSTSKGSVRRQKKIPAMIIMGPRPTSSTTGKTYANAANSTASSVTNSTNQQSNGSGNSSSSAHTSSTTQSGKSAREIELEEELQSMTTKLDKALESLATTQANLGEKQLQLEAALQENEKLHGQLQKSLDDMEEKIAATQQEQREQIEAQQQKLKQEMETMFMERMAETMRHVQQMMQQPVASTMTPEPKRQDARGTPPLHMNNAAFATQHYNHGAYFGQYPPPHAITTDPYGRQDHCNYSGTFQHSSHPAGSIETVNQSPIRAMQGPSHEAGPATG